MSQGLPRICSDDVVRVLKGKGFILDRQKGSHAIFICDDQRVVVPIHKKEILKLKTLSGIIKDMGLSIDEFRDEL